MHDEFLKVGELARRTGVSVRTLHHYDAIGLLRPAVGGHGSHRLYGRAEVERLARIRSLQALGLSLTEITECLDDPKFEPSRVIEMHLERLETELEQARALRDRLEAVARSLRAADEASTELFLQTIEVIDEMETFEKYYSPEQLDYLKKRAEEVGPERIARAQEDWTELFAAFREARERGDDPTSQNVRELARRARELIEAFTGGDEGVRQSLGKMYAENPDMPQKWGVEPELWSYVNAAQAALDS